MIRSRYRLILILAIVAVLLVASYFVVTRVILKEEETPTVAVTPPTLTKGEYYVASTNTLAVFPYASVDDISRFEVHNEKGDFAFVYSDKYKNIRLEGYEGLTPQSQLLTTMLTYACIPNTTRRLTDGSNTNTIVYQSGDVRNDVSLSQYGLDADSDPVWYRVTLKQADGSTVTHKVYLGDYTPLKDGFYCRYEGRNEIYVVSLYFQYLTLNKEAFLTPTIIKTNADAAFPYLDRIRLSKNGNLFVEGKFHIDNYGTAAGRVYTLNYPVTANGYTYDANVSLFTALCNEFIHLQGTQVVEVLSRDTDVRTDEYMEQTLAKYGLSHGKDNAYLLEYGWDGISEDDLGDLGHDDITQEGTTLLLPVFFSEKTEDNTYYVYTIVLGEDGSLYEQIVEADAAMFPYLEYDLIAFVDPSVYYNSITGVSKITYKGSYTDDDGNTFSVNETFQINHSVKTTLDESTGESTEKNVYGVDCLNSGYKYATEKATYFASLYTVTMTNPKYIDSVSQAEFDRKEYFGEISFVILKDGKEQEPLTFTFYRVSSTLLGVSVDGGETITFAVHYLSVNEIMLNVNRVAQGQHVIVSRSNQLASVPTIEAK